MVHRTLEVQCSIHKGFPIIRIMSRIYPVPHINTIYLRSILILSSYLRLILPKDLFPEGTNIPVKLLKGLLLYSIPATCAAQLNLLDLIAMIILGGWHKL